MNRFKIWDTQRSKFFGEIFTLGVDTVNFAYPHHYVYLFDSGLKDCEGSAIFEGDIVKVQYVPAENFFVPVVCGTVKFQNGAFYLECSSTDGIPKEYIYSELLSKYSLNLLEDRRCVIKVVGNIYENQNNENDE